MRVARRIGAKMRLEDLWDRREMAGEGRDTALTVGRRLALRIKDFRAARASLRMESAERGFLALGFRGLYGRWLNFDPALRAFPAWLGLVRSCLPGLLLTAGLRRADDERFGLVGIGLCRDQGRLPVGGEQAAITVHVRETHAGGPDGGIIRIRGVEMHEGVAELLF